MSARAGWRKALEPRPRELRDYLESSAFVGGVIQLATAILVGAIATSRAEGHQLTPWTLALLVAAAAGAGVSIGWPVGVYGGAGDMLKGLVITNASATDPTVDELGVRRLWTNVAAWGGAAALWAFAAGALVAVVLNGRHAGAVLAIAALAALGGVTGCAVDIAARRRGIELVRARAGAPVPERRRAWLHLALPLASVQGLVNAGLAWMLFHDYVQGDAFATRALLEGPVVAEVGSVVLLLVLVFGPIVRSWGEVDAALDRVVLPDAARTVTPVGSQAFVYLAVTGLLLGPAVGLLLPATPSLARVILVRGGLAFVLVFIVAGLAHVRGAMNHNASAEPRTVLA